MPHEIGTGDRVDAILREYRGLTGGPLKNETDELLAAILLELQFERQTSGGPSSIEVVLADKDTETEDERTTPKYTVRSVTVDVSTDTVNWPFQAASVALYGWTDDIRVALADPDDTPRDVWMPLDAADEPLTLTGDDGIGATQLWYELQSGASQTTLNALAFE